MKFQYQIIMKQLLTLLFVSFILSIQTDKLTAQNLFNDGWKFVRCDSLTTQVNNSFFKNKFDDSSWEQISLPHTSRIEPLVVNDQWQGDCLYRKTFELPKIYQNKILFIKFDAAMNAADIWINGEKVGSHLGGYLPFSIDITSKIHFGVPNTIVVKLDNRDNPVTGPKPLKLLDFNTYGGIYRNVSIIAKSPVYITDANYENVVAGGGTFFYATNISSVNARIHARTHVRNRSDKDVKVKVIYSLYNMKKIKVATFESPKQTLLSGKATTYESAATVVAPQLWSPDTPSLYTLRTIVLVDNKKMDEEQTRVGIRDIKITNEGCWINGKKTFLRGVNRHQEYPYIGYALSDNAQYRDAYIIKQSGFDYVRCSHYPPSPAFLDACDELGIVVLDAVLGWQYFGDEAFAQHILKSSRQLIRRDRNHPSVLAWELSINESAMPESFMKQAHQIAKEEYPYGKSYSASWINKVYDIYIEARQHRHGEDKLKPFIVSEYGDWEYYAQNAGFNQDSWADLKSEERNSRQPRDAGEIRLLQQARNVQEAHNDNLSTHAFADGYWAMFDYNRGYSDDLEYSGVMDIFRLPKYASYFFQSQRSPQGEGSFSKPMIFIASEWMPNVSKNVRIFSNCDEVELYVDGKLLERRKPDTDLLSLNLKHPPFTFNISCLKAGKLEAVGYIKNKKSVSQIVQTAGSVDHLALSCNIAGRNPQAGCNDVVFIYATLQDKQGFTVTNTKAPIRFVVEGDAEIVGNTQPVTEAGIAPILLRIGNKKESIKIKVFSDKLQSAELLIKPE